MSGAAIANPGPVADDLAPVPGSPAAAKDRRTIEVDKEACLELGEAPGLGILLDEERLASTRIG